MPSLLATAFCLWALGGVCAVPRAEDAPQPKAETPALENDPIKAAGDLIKSFKSRPPLPSPTSGQKKVEERVAVLEKKIEAAKTPDEKKAVIRSEAEGLADQMLSAELQTAPKEYRAQVSNGVAGVLNQIGSSDKAKALSDDVLGRDPDDRDALNARAISNYQLGRYPEAIHDATRVSQLEPRSERAYATRALANYQMRNFASALDDANMALSLNPNNQLAFQISKLSETRVTKASSLGLDAAQQAAADKISREYNAMVEQKAQAEAAAAVDAPAPAAEPLAKAVFTADKMVDSLNQKALTNVRMGDARAAIENANKVLELDEKNPKAYTILAAAQNMMGLYQEAFEDATQALNNNPDNAWALDVRAAAFLGMNRFAEAMADAERAILLNPKNPDAYLHRGQGREGLGDLKGMLEDYRKAAELNPKHRVFYTEGAAKYRLEPKSTAPAGPQANPFAAKKPASGRRFIVVLLCSLTGGFLIALGLLHVLSGRKAAAAATTRKQAASSFEASFQIVRSIGQGGMGVVYEAVDKALGRKVAIKKMRDELKTDQRERERFLHEARTVAALHHPNIVDIHTILESDGDLYLVFEYVQGRTLDEILAQKKRLSLAEAQFIARGVMTALAYAHQQGVVHRDMKPSNVMVTQDGWVKVMDFGIARHAKDAASKYTAANMAIGTPPYMAPEQERGEVRPESDIYAFACVLYEMLTGERTFQGQATTSAKLNKQYKKPTRVVGSLPPAVDAFIDAALEPDPDKRIKTPAEFRARLDAAFGPIQPPPKA